MCEAERRSRKCLHASNIDPLSLLDPVLGGTRCCCCRHLSPVSAFSLYSPQLFSFNRHNTGIKEMPTHANNADNKSGVCRHCRHLRGLPNNNPPILPMPFRSVPFLLRFQIRQQIPQVAHQPVKVPVRIVRGMPASPNGLEFAGVANQWLIHESNIGKIASVQPFLDE